MNNVVHGDKRFVPRNRLSEIADSASVFTTMLIQLAKSVRTKVYHAVKKYGASDINHVNRVQIFPMDNSTRLNDQVWPVTKPQSSFLVNLEHPTIFPLTEEMSRA